MGHEIESHDPVSWQAGFDDALAGRRSPQGDELAYRSGHVAGSARRISRRTMVAAALAVLAVPTAAALASPETDPIFAAIEKHRRAWAAMNDAAHNDDHARLHEAVLTAESEVVNTRPTTGAGVVALRTYHRELRDRGHIYEQPYPREDWSGGKG